MKIGIQTWGSDGDVNPFLALAGGLAAAGHQVTLAVTSAERKDYGGYGRRMGFALVEAGHIGRDRDDLVRISKKAFEERNPLKQLDIILEEMFEPGVERMLAAARELAESNDLVIGHFIVHPAQAASALAAKPYLTVSLNHSAIPSGDLPMMGVPSLGPILNALVWKLGHRILNGHIAPHVNRLRARLGLAPVASFRDVWESPRGNLIAVSPHLIRPWRDREPHQVVCGHFALPDASHDYALPEELGRFLDDGPPPVYMTFGSMTVMDDGGQGYLEESARLLIDAAREAGCRALVQTRWDLVGPLPEHPDLFKMSSAPHSRVFPRCALVVHHGGAGTTHAALAHGLPAVVVPHFSDQFFWAREVEALGLGVAAPKRWKISARTLAKAIRRALGDEALRARARAAGAEVAREDGVARAVRHINGLSP